MKKAIVFLCLLCVLFSATGCNEPDFREATITLDSAENICCNYYSKDAVLYTFTFSYVKDDIPEIGELAIDIWQDKEVHTPNHHPIYWSHILFNGTHHAFNGAVSAYEIELKSGYTLSFQVCAPKELTSIVFDCKFRTKNFTHIYYYRSQEIQLKKDD